MADVSFRTQLWGVITRELQSGCPLPRIPSGAEDGRPVSFDRRGRICLRSKGKKTVSITSWTNQHRVLDCKRAKFHVKPLNF